MKNLGEAFRKYGCDKVDHYYHDVYERDFGSFKSRVDTPKILEIGIWKGASTQAFLEYYNNIEIYGIDIFTRLNPEDVPVLQDPRVHWMKGDSTKDPLPHDWPLFDAIIDDGHHTPLSNAKTFLSTIAYLKKGGIYYVEDVWPLDEMAPHEWNHRWIKSHSADYNMVNWNIFAKTIQYYEVERIDLRKMSGKPDSYLFRISK